MDAFWQWWFTADTGTTPAALAGWVSIGAWLHIGVQWWRQRRTARSTACPPR